MRIIGKTHDYYDSALAFGHDDSVVFERAQEEFWRRDIPNDLGFLEPGLNTRTSYWIGGYGRNRETGFDKNRKGTRFAYYPFTVAFCGKLYPGIELAHQVPGCGNWNKEHFYDFDTYAAGLKKHGLEFKEPRKHRERWYWNQRHAGKGSVLLEEDVRPYFERAGEDHVEFFGERRQPIVAWMPEDEPYLVVNPVLADVSFYRVYDAYRAFQELDMFVSGVMTHVVSQPSKKGRKLPNPVDIGDEDLRDKKGFDDMSFKKQKTKKRK